MSARAPEVQTPPYAAAEHGQAAEEDADLRAALAGLARLTVAQAGLPAMLTHVAEFAVAGVPGADGAGLTLWQDDRADTVVASAEFVRQVDAIQYGLGEGPCITAAADGRTVRSGELGEDRRWPQFGQRACQLEVHSVLSLPLRSSASVIGALNIYAHVKDTFDDRALQLGELFAIPAAIAVQSANALDEARRLTKQLQTALSSRAVIDHAIGIVMSRSGCTPAEAFDKLRALSQKENRKLSLIAQQVLDEAVGRARARHSPS